MAWQTMKEMMRRMLKYILQRIGRRIPRILTLSAVEHTCGWKEWISKPRQIVSLMLDTLISLAKSMPLHFQPLTPPITMHCDEQLTGAHHHQQERRNMTGLSNCMALPWYLLVKV